MQNRMTRFGGAACAAALALLLGGCATNSASTLIDASRYREAAPQVPSSAVVEDELAGRALRLGRVYADLGAQDPKERMHVAPETLAALFERPARRAFEAAKLGGGKMPAYTVDYVITGVKLREGVTLHPSVLVVRMEISRPDQSRVMSAEFQSRYLLTIPPAMLPGEKDEMPTYNSPVVALARMAPATAVVVTRVAAGLQQGKTLDEIAVYPDAVAAGNLITPPGSFLRGRPYGLRPLTSTDMEEVARQIDAQP